MITYTHGRIEKEKSRKSMHSIFWEYAVQMHIILFSKQYSSNANLKLGLDSNLGLTVDSSIAKWGMQGYKEERMEKVGLQALEKGHQDA